MRALAAVCAGSRDPGLAQTSGLHYSMSAEILLLIETLPPERRHPAGPPPPGGD